MQRKPREFLKISLQLCLILLIAGLLTACWGSDEEEPEPMDTPVPAAEEAKPTDTPEPEPTDTPEPASEEEEGEEADGDGDGEGDDDGDSDSDESEDDDVEGEHAEGEDSDSEETDGEHAEDEDTDNEDADSEDSDASEGEEEAVEPRVYFKQPTNHATLPMTSTVIMAAEGLVIEPLGEIKEGAGHMHILVDTDFVPAGEIIISDEQHLHFGDGSVETELSLSPGEHILRLQFADGVHTALEGDQYRDEITVTVEEAATAETEIPAPEGEVILTLTGDIGVTNEGDTLVFDIETLESLGLTELTVTDPWEEEEITYTGVLVTDLLAAAGASDAIESIIPIAADDYTVSIPLSELEEHDAILATQANGEYMSAEDKGPTRIIFPYDTHPNLELARTLSIWQIVTIDIQ